MRSFLRRSLTLTAVLAAVTAAAAAAPAAASAAEVPNACGFSGLSFAYDSPINISVSGNAEVLPDADGRYPSQTEVTPGALVRTTDVTVDATLPDQLAPLLYQLGWIQGNTDGSPRLNTLPITAWFDVRASNTVEGVRREGPFVFNATTNVVIDAQQNFVSATPFAFPEVELPDRTWTATGGPVEVSQAPRGAVGGTLPTGPNNALRSVSGSAVIAVNFPPPTTARVTLDCAPSVLTPPTFASIPGPRNNQCLSSAGRALSGTAAGVPVGVSRELDPLGIALTAPAAATTFEPGKPYLLAGAKLGLTIPADVAGALGRASYNAPTTDLVTASQDYSGRVWVAIRGENTTEGVQVVEAALTYRLEPDPIGQTADWKPVSMQLTLPDTTWTPSGFAPLRFTQAAPGSLPAMTLPGVGAQGVTPTPYSTKPYGSVFVRLVTNRHAETFDCLPAAVTAIAPGVAWSDGGDVAPPAGSQGRYTVASAHPTAVTAPFLTATRVIVDPPVDPDDGDDVPPVQQPPVGPPAVEPGPPPAAAPVGVPSVTGKSLRRKGSKLPLTIACSAIGPCAGAIELKTTGRVRVGKKRKLVTVVRRVNYSVQAGRSGKLSLRLSTDARKALQRSAKLRVRITLRPTSGPAITKTMDVKR